MAGICLFHRDDSDAIAAPFGWEPEVDNLRELRLEEGDKDLVQRLAEDGGFVRRAARVRTEVNRLLAHCDRSDGEDRELLD